MSASGRDGRLRELVVAQGLLSVRDLDDAVDRLEERRLRGERLSLGRHLVELGLVDAGRLADVLAEAEPSGGQAATVLVAGMSDPTLCDSFAGGTVLEEAARAAGRPVAVHLAGTALPAGGERFGRYVGAVRLAQGGMGAVYRAIDPELGRPVAIKVILAGCRAAEGELARFLREAQVTGQLQHPNIPPLYELSSTPDGQVYFAMKLIEGRSLAEILALRSRTGPAALAAARTELLGALVKVCDALAYAHSRGVIHRDLKPANIMVGAYGEVLVMDWGIARIQGTSDLEVGRLASPAEVDPLRTLEGSVLGTPAYMSPEQMLGRLEEIDERSDVYGLGSVIYEVLTGTTQDSATTLDQLLANIETGRWVPPSRRTPGGGVPAELDALVARAMHRDRAQRYGSALDLKADLEAWLTGRPLAAFRYTAGQRAAKWVRRNKSVTAFLASVSILLPLLGLALASSLRANAEAKASAERADLQLRDVLALSEISGVDELLAPDRLVEAWDGYPGDATELERWIAQAGQFEDRGAYHRAKLDELEARGEGRASDRWERKNRAHLVDRLDELLGSLAEARAALEKASALQRRLEEGGDRRAWDEARGAGLSIGPVAGLLPIGRDPSSGLWEFAVVETGEAPVRDAGGKLEVDPGSAIVLVLLPAGAFRMGSTALPSEQPVHDVTVPAILISKYELTRAQWLRATGSDPSFVKGGDARAPVDQVSWDECRRTLSRWGLRLPSEAEWEYAARAGTTDAWWTREFARSANLADQTGLRWGLTQGESWDDGEAGTCRVGKYLANPFGLHDTMGNVWEWCADAYRDDYRGAPADGSAGAGDRVIRGGSYAWPSSSARSSFRFRFVSTLRCYDLGVRPAMSLR